MGGRGKSSGAARSPKLSGGPLNFGDSGAIPLERLQAKAPRRVGPGEVAEGIEQVVEQLLTAPPALYAKHQAALEQKMVELADALKGRPVEEREAFSEALSPLLERLRAHAEGRSS